MGEHSEPVEAPAEQVIKEIRRATRRQFSAEEEIGIVLSGLRGEDSIAAQAGAKGSCRTSIGAGRRSFWKPARRAWPATRRDRQPRRRSRTCAGKPAR